MNLAVDSQSQQTLEWNLRLNSQVQVGLEKAQFKENEIF